MGHPPKKQKDPESVAKHPIKLFSIMDRSSGAQWRKEGVERKIQGSEEKEREARGGNFPAALEGELLKRKG